VTTRKYTSTEQIICGQSVLTAKRKWKTQLVTRRHGLRDKVTINLSHTLHGYPELLGFGLCSSPGVMETRKHNFSEIGSVSILR
jgi:hypothetical protein